MRKNSEYIIMNPIFTDYNFILVYFKKDGNTVCFEELKTYYYGERINKYIKLLNDEEIHKVLHIINKQHSDITGLIDISSYNISNETTIIPENSKLYFDKSCDIPRKNITDLFKRTIKKDLADYIVIKDFDTNIRKCYVFTNNNSKTVYIVYKDTSRYNYSLNKTIHSELNLSKEALNSIDPYTHVSIDNIKAFEALKESYITNLCNHSNSYYALDWNDFMNSTLYYDGIIASDSSEAALSCKFDNIPYITEKSLTNQIQTLNKHNDLDEESILSIYKMLSKDYDTRALALKTLAEYNYLDYPNTISYILGTTSNKWDSDAIKHSTSVKYMLRTIYQRDNIRYCYVLYKDNIKQKDFDILIKLIKDDIEKTLKDVLKKISNQYPFMNVTYNPNLEFKPFIKENDDK